MVNSGIIITSKYFSKFWAGFLNVIFMLFNWTFQIVAQWWLHFVLIWFAQNPVTNTLDLNIFWISKTHGILPWKLIWKTSLEIFIEILSTEKLWKIRATISWKNRFFDVLIFFEIFISSTGIRLIIILKNTSYSFTFDFITKAGIKKM